MRRVLALRDGGVSDGGRRLLVIRSWVMAVSAVAAIVIGAVLGAPANAARGANPAEAYVQTNIDRGYQILNNSGQSRQAKREAFRQFLLTLINLKRIANYTLGRAGAGASAADKADFYSAFEDFVVAVYDQHLSKYRGQTLKVTGSQVRSADDTVVNATVVNPNNPDAPKIKVAFRVRLDGGNMVVTDMQVEGVWLSISQQQDFAAYLAQHGNRVPALTAHLRQAAQKIERTGRIPRSDEDE